MVDLDTIHALTYLVPPPGPSRFMTLDNSTETLQLLRTQNHSHTHRTQFNDFAHEDTWLFKQIRQTVNQQFDSGILVNSIPASKVELAGMYVWLTQGTGRP